MDQGEDSSAVEGEGCIRVRKHLWDPLWYSWRGGSYTRVSCLWSHAQAHTCTCTCTYEMNSFMTYTYAHMHTQLVVHVMVDVCMYVYAHTHTLTHRDDDQQDLYEAPDEPIVSSGPPPPPRERVVPPKLRPPIPIPTNTHSSPHEPLPPLPTTLRPPVDKSKERTPSPPRAGDRPKKRPQAYTHMDLPRPPPDGPRSSQVSLILDAHM